MTTNAGEAETSIYYRYVTREELEALQENPVLNPGETSGKGFFTTDVYSSRSVAYDRLSLFEEKEYRIALRFTGNPDVVGPSPVPETYFPGTDIIRTAGGGVEYYITEPAAIELVGEPFLLGP